MIPEKKLFFSINLLLKDYVSYGDLDQIYRLMKVMYHSKEEPILNFITRARLINVVWKLLNLLIQAITIV